MPRPSQTLLSLALAALLLGAGQAGAQVTAPETVTVQPGETAYSIARRAGLSVADLLSLNGLKSADLRAGQVLRIGRTPPPPAAPQTYTVQPGDTLYSLARRFGVSVDALLAENTLPVGAALAVGQVLRLPAGAGLGAAPVAVPAPPPVTPASGMLPSPFVPGPVPQQGPALGPAQPLPPLPGVPGASMPAPMPGDWRGAALALLGTPYTYGGTTPQGTDCSGLVVQVFAPLGVRLPRTSAAQADTGEAVEAGAWQPGDLVFFDTQGAGRVTHVGIYLGDDTFVNANTYQGRVVVDRLMADPYWSARYVTARRVLPSPAAMRP